MLNGGMRVDHDTALQFSAVFRAIGYISGQLAMLPWRVMTENNGRKEVIRTHHVDRLLHSRPNPEMSAFVFRETLTAHALTWGNGYAEIERDGANRPTALWPISPDRVEVKRDEGVIYYEVSNSAGPNNRLSADNVYHLHGLGFDGLVGYSVVNLARRGIGLGLAAEQTGTSIFENGLMTNLVVEHPEAFGESAYKNFKDSLLGWVQGPKKAGNPLILEEGIKAKNLQMPMDDMQFLETRQFQVQDIARWFGLPPHKLQSLENATFSNIEQQSIEVVVDALQPWATRMEQEADYKLFGQRGSFYTKLNLNALLRGDMAARSTFYRELWNLGVLSVNEIREFEDMNPVPFGEKRFVQLNMTTLENAGEQPDPAPVPVVEETPEIDEAAEKIANRERFRLHDAVRRHAGDRGGFVNWMTTFMPQHEVYCADKLKDIAPDDVTRARIPEIRQRMLNYFDDGVPYPVEQIAGEIKSALLGNDYGNKSERLSN